MKMKLCKSCGADIYWIAMASGKAMPVDAKTVFGIPSIESVSDKEEKFITKDGHIISGHRVPVVRRLYVPHWSTCPNADSHREKG